MTTITVPVDTLIHTDAHPYCEDSTCPCQGAQTAASVDLTGYEFGPRTIRHRGRGQDIQIAEEVRPQVQDHDRRRHPYPRPGRGIGARGDAVEVWHSSSQRAFTLCPGVWHP